LYLWKGNPITRYCFPTCTNCITSEINKCTACYSDYLAVVSYTDILKGNPSTFSCDSKCPTTHFYTLDPQILTLPPGTGIKYCMPCESVVQNCIQCYRASSTSSLICLNCRAGFFVSVDASTSYSNTCQKCDDSCAECSGDMLTCTKCATGKMLKLVSGKVRCVPDDKTLALTNRVCPYNKFLYQGQCLDECPEGTYRRKYYTDDCASCTVATTGCFDCDKVTSTCTTCHPNYKSFAAGACYFCNQNNIQCCAYGFGWTVSGTCSACSVANSVDCLMPSNAIQCNSVGSYVLNALGSCLSPITNCNSYNFDASKCTQCSKGTMLSGSTCVATCGSLYEYFSNSNKICSACHSYCTTCSAPGLSGKCSACAAATAGIYPVTGGCNQCDNIVSS
jgi:proprotein convertase subtilisin/kexin type 5